MFLDTFLPIFVFVLFVIGVHKVHLTGPAPLWDFLLDTLEYIQRYATIVKIFLILKCACDYLFLHKRVTS
jgi:hypothetical protein